MATRTRLALAAAAALALASSLRASETPTDEAPNPDLPKYLADAPPPRKPLMEGLNAIGLAQPLEKYNVNIYGYVEGSWTYNFDRPKNGVNALRSFDQDHNDVRLNQWDLTVERTVDVKKWDIGGRMEWIWGSDAGFIHSNGLFDWYDSPRHPDEQWDLNQAYIDFGVPVGNGLLVRAGKSVTLLGQETINPNGNALFSHSYLFNFAIPFTQTGVTATYAFNDRWSITAGTTRGWDQSVEDNNSAWDFLGEVKWTPSKTATIVFNSQIGPEDPNDNSHWRTILDLIANQAVGDRWNFAVNADYGWDTAGGTGDDTAYWYGVAGYAGYKINDYLTLNGRLEWFRDEQGFRTGTAATYAEATLGLAIKPMPRNRWGQNLLIRPEIRGDWSNKSVYDSGDDGQMYTAAVDVIFNY